MSSPCGMLAPWALHHKAWKKRIAWYLYQRRDLDRARILAVTSQQELVHVRRSFPTAPIALIPNGVELPPTLAQQRETNWNTEKRLVFLGRVYPVKGLLNLVEAWHSVQPQGWRCVIAGPDEAGHQREVESSLRDRGMEGQFEFPGLVGGYEKWRLLAGADLFVLPSFTENFGIAVAEALAAGVPVITTKGTPWEELLTHRCGWWVDIGVEPLAAALREAMALSDGERHEMGLRGRKLVEEKYSWPKIAANMKSVYEWVLGRGPKPGCVV